MKPRWIAGLVLLSAPAAAVAQQQAIVGTWQFDANQGPRSDGPRTVVVRPDSSASYGTETVRWRILGDSLSLALGGEWVNYRMRMKQKKLTLSGGDLTKPMIFQLIGPPSPRPDTIPVPPDPDTEPG